MNSTTKKFQQLFILSSLTVVMLVGFKFVIDKSTIRNTVLQFIQNGVSAEQLVLFRFSKAETVALKWKKENEFEYLGEMYDIVYFKFENDTVFYSCFHDTKETKYRRKFYKLLGYLLLPDSGQNNNGPSKNTDLMVYFSESPKQYSGKVNDRIFRSYHGIYINLYCYLNSGPNSPPPKV